MKKYHLIILSIMFLIVSFIKSWYGDYLFDRLFIFDLIPNILLMILFNFLLIKCIISIKKEKRIIDIISIIVLFSSVFLFLFFPFREAKFKFEFNQFKPKRLEIIQMIKDRELVPKDDIGNIELPYKYKKYSTSGEVFVYQNNKQGQVIGFWIFRGMLSGSIELIYSTGGEDLIKVNETGHQIINIEKLEENWYLVNTDS